MRRGCSAILFFLGGWILASVGVAGLAPPDEEFSPWLFVAIFAVFAAPFLLSGTWVSPGRRWAELGLTLMISAGVAALVLVTMAAVSVDPAFKRLLKEPMPAFDWASPAAILSILLIGGGGYWLWRRQGKA